MEINFSIDAEKFLATLSIEERDKHRLAIDTVFVLQKMIKEKLQAPSGTKEAEELELIEEEKIELMKSLAYTLFDLFLRVNKKREAFTEGVSIEVYEVVGGAKNIFSVDEAGHA